MALASRSSLPLQLLRYASSHLSALYHRRPPSARLQLSAAASSYKEAAGNDGDGIIAAAATCAPVEVDAAAAADEQLGKARRGALLGYPHEGRPSQPKEGNLRDMLSSNPSPPGPPVEGSGGNGGAHH